MQLSHALHSKLAKHHACCRQLRDTAAPGMGSMSPALNPEPL